MPLWNFMIHVKSCRWKLSNVLWRTLWWTFHSIRLVDCALSVFLRRYVLFFLAISGFQLCKKQQSSSFLKWQLLFLCQGQHFASRIPVGSVDIFLHYPNSWVCLKISWRYHRQTISMWSCCWDDFVEGQVDRLVGQDHLFKRSVILVKAWCYYESRILGAHHGLISTYALETLVLYIFHVFHSSLRGPLQVSHLGGSLHTCCGDMSFAWTTLTLK